MWIFVDFKLSYNNEIKFLQNVEPTLLKAVNDAQLDSFCFVW